MKKVIFRIVYTITLICYMVNIMSISGYCENKTLDYRFCYGYFETSNEEISGYKKLMVHNEIVYMSIEDFMILSNILVNKGKWGNYNSLSNEIKQEFLNSDNIYYFSKIGINLNWLFSVGSSKAFSLSQYNGIQSIDLGGEVVLIGEEIYIPFQALFSIFNVPYSIEEDIIEVYNPIYTPLDYMHMERLNHLIYNVTPDSITSGKIGSFIDYIDDGFGIVADFSIHKIPEFIGEISGELPSEKSCEELTKMLCQVDEIEKNKLLEYSDLTLNSLLPVISEISENTITDDMDVVESIKVLTEYCNDNSIINVNGNEFESKYLLNFVLNTEIGDKYAQAIKSEVISKFDNTVKIGGKAIEKYIVLDTIARTSTNENIVNAIHSYCNNFITTGKLNNPTKFKNYILDYTFYDDKELLYDVKAVPLDFLDKDLILNGNNAPYKKGLSNQIVTYINENSDKYIDKEKQKEYGYKLFTDGMIELLEDIETDKILKNLKKLKSIKNVANMKSAFGILNAEWNILKLFSNEANGTFDFYEANKMLLYVNGLEKDATNAVKAIKSHLNIQTFNNQIEQQYTNENEYWDNYCDLEYVRLKSYYIAHSLVKSKNEQYVKLMNSLREQELHSYNDDVPKYIRISSEKEYNQIMNYYSGLVEKENLILDELSDYMVGVLNAKQNLEKVKSTNYSKEADAELINMCCQKITGTVKDSNGKAINDVIVHFKNGTDTYFVKSNEFPIYLKTGDYEVSISDDRYDEYTSKISLDKFGAVSIDIVLTTSKTNYTWHLEPTIEAEDIVVIDNKENFLKNGYIYPYDECALIKQNGKYGIIQYDGTKIAEPLYELGNYDIQGTIYVYNEYDQTKGAERVDVFPDKGELRIQINQERGWGYVGSEYLWINNKVANTIDGYSIFSGEYYDDDYNVVVQSAQLDSDKRFVNISNKYGIANKNSLLVPIEYDKGYMHSYNNIIALCKGEKWTYFNENGKSIIENCDGFESNSNVIDLWQGGNYKFYENYILPYIPTENYIPIKINGKCGYYDTQGNEVIPRGTFEEVRPVHNGLAWVKKDGKWGVIKLKEIEIEQNKENNTSKNEQQQQIKELLFTGTVNTEKDPLNVRKSPSVNAEIIGQIEKGSTVTVYSESGDWYEIEYNGGVGYVSKKYIKSKGNNSDTQTSKISDNEILKAVNKYLEENQSNLGVWLSDSDPYCPAEHMHSNSTNWSCPINLNWESYSSNEIAGAYPHFAYVDKETLKCTLTANYETVVEFDLRDYTITGNAPWTSEQIINSINAYLKENWCGENQYYCFEEELIEHNGYLWVCIRWNGSNSANVITGSDCKINKETGEVEISFNGEPYEWFNLKDYQ